MAISFSFSRRSSWNLCKRQSICLLRCCVSVTQKCTFKLLKCRFRFSFWLREPDKAWWEPDHKKHCSYVPRSMPPDRALSTRFSCAPQQLFLLARFGRSFFGICVLAQSAVSVEPRRRKHKTSRLNELCAGCSLWFLFRCLFQLRENAFLASFFLLDGEDENGGMLQR